MVLKTCGLKPDPEVLTLTLCCGDTERPQVITFRLALVATQLLVAVCYPSHA